MKQSRFAGTLLALSLCLPALVQAGEVQIIVPPMTIDRPANGTHTPWQVLAVVDSQSSTICGEAGVKDGIDRVIVNSYGHTSIGSVSHNGLTLPVYPTTDPEIGYALSTKVTSVTDANDNVTSVGGPYFPVEQDNTELWEGRGLAGDQESVNAEAQMLLVTTDKPLTPGSKTNITLGGVPDTGGQYECSDLLNIINPDIGWIKIPPFNINVAASTCTVSMTYHSIPFGTLTANDFPTVGSVSPEKFVRMIPLLCDPNINIKFTVTDVQDPANRTDTVTLPSAATLKGFGVQVLDEMNGTGLPYLLGPDSSDPNAENQHPAFNSGAGGSIEIPYGVQFIRTGDITPGTANVKATFTFSYQ